MSDTQDFIPYSSLRDDQRGVLASKIDMSDLEAATKRLQELSSDNPVSDADAKLLGWVVTYRLGLSTQKRDKVVTRAKRRGRIGNLDSFIASLNGAACGIDPDTVVYVRDEDGEEVMTTVGKGDTKRRVPLAEVRGNASDRAGVMVRLSDGSEHQLADGRKCTPRDVGGEDKWHDIREFSRDGGETWAPVRWSLTFPNRTN